jgi:hypothetical protein
MRTGKSAPGYCAITIDETTGQLTISPIPHDVSHARQCRRADAKGEAERLFSRLRPLFNKRASQARSFQTDNGEEFYSADAMQRLGDFSG